MKQYKVIEGKEGLNEAVLNKFAQEGYVIDHVAACPLGGSYSLVYVWMSRDVPDENVQDLPAPYYTMNLHRSGTGIKEIDDELEQRWTFSHTSPCKMVMSSKTLEYIRGLMVNYMNPTMLSNPVKATYPQPVASYVNKFVATLTPGRLANIDIDIDDELEDGVIEYEDCPK